MQVETVKKATVQVGRDASGRRIEIEIELRAKPEGVELSMSANCWNRPKTDIVWGGQSQDQLLSEIKKFDVSRETVEQIVAVWNRWHLNAMRPGCEHQRAEGWDKRPIDPSKPLDVYGDHLKNGNYSWNMLTWITPKDRPDGLMTVPCKTCGYRYGTSWLFEVIPAEVLAQINRWLDPNAWNPKQVLSPRA